MAQSRLASAVRRPVALKMAAAVATKAKAKAVRKPKVTKKAEDEEVPVNTSGSKLVIVESPAKARTIQVRCIHHASLHP